MNTEHVTQIRRFNRLVTQRAGALEDHFLGRDRPLGHSRVLYEIGARGADLRELRDRLGLDSGYLSRVVKALAAQGLITVAPEPHDERLRRVRITPEGRVELAEMDRRSDEAAEEILAALTPGQGQRLVDAMTEVYRLLYAAGAEIGAVDPASAPAEWCVSQYFEELDRRFDDGFDPECSLIAENVDFRRPRGTFVVASVDGEPVACGAIRTESERIGSIKRMWVAPSMRGLGFGRRMLEALEAEARAMGLSTLQLETNAALEEAVGLYRTAGYREVERFSDDPYASCWFRKVLSEEGGS